MSASLLLPPHQNDYYGHEFVTLPLEPFLRWSRGLPTSSSGVDNDLVTADTDHDSEEGAALSCPPARRVFTVTSTLVRTEDSDPTAALSKLLERSRDYNIDLSPHMVLCRGRCAARSWRPLRRRVLMPLRPAWWRR